MGKGDDSKRKIADKKDKVIHTRVPDALDEELKETAANLGISVSNLVRNILNNAVDLIEDVIVDGSQVGRAAAGVPGSPRGKRRSTKPRPSGGDPEGDSVDAPILGWQRITLNLNAVCSRCNDVLLKGSEATLGLTNVPAAPTTILCLKCLKEVQS